MHDAVVRIRTDAFSAAVIMTCRNQLPLTSLPRRTLCHFSSGNAEITQCLEI